MIKKPAALLVIVFMVISLMGCTPRAQPVSIKKPQVVVTLFPQYDFVRQIAGDKVDLVLLLPPGVEPHAFEPSPRDIVDVQKADLFIYTGKYMEPWAQRIIDAAQGKSLLIVDASLGIELLDEDDHHHHQHHHDDDDHHHDDDDHHHDDDDDHHDDDDDHDDDDHHHDDDDHHDDHDEHHHGGQDPHIWLDPVYAQKMVDNIVHGLSQIDPDNSALYSDNGESYKAKLRDLDSKLAAAFAKLENKTILYAGHFAFGYFAQRYGLTHTSPYSGFAPNAEPTPQRIAELIKNVRETKSKVIYYEELIDPKVARVIAEQTGARMVLLHGAHNVSKDELTSGITYLEIMEENLFKLVEGLSGQ